MILGTLHTNPDRFCDTQILCAFESGTQGPVTRDNDFRGFQLIAAYQTRRKAVGIDVGSALDHRSCFLCSKLAESLDFNRERVKITGFLVFSQDLAAESFDEAKDGALDGVGARADA